MPKITYIEFNGKEHQVDVETGATVMEGALDNDVPGIEAICGGSCSCSTCHVYVDDAWVAKIPEKDDMETDVLESAADVKPTSRLSCQIEITNDLDGLVVRLPEEQAI